MCVCVCVCVCINCYEAQNLELNVYICIVVDSLNLLLLTRQGSFNGIFCTVRYQGMP